MTLNGTHLVTYLNGIEELTLACSRTAGDPGCYVFGANTDCNLASPGLFLNGLVDEVRIYNRTLSQTELRNMYYQGINNMTRLGAEEIGDITPPTWSNMITNATTNQTKTGEEVYFNITLTDETAPGYYVFNFSEGTAWISNSDTWENNTPVQIIKTITATRGQNVSWYWEFNDSAGNSDQTGIWNITIANTAPTHDDPILNSTFGTNFRTENLTCYNQSTHDADNDVVTNVYSWFKNDKGFEILNIPFESNARDYSYYNYTATIYGSPQFVTGKLGKALDFDGVDDYVDYGVGVSSKITSSYTIETWIKPDSVPVSGEGLASAQNLKYGITYYTDGKVWAYVDGGSNSIRDSVPIEQWTYIVATFNGTYLKLYKNGIEVASANYAGKTPAGGTAFRIGHHSGYFNGIIDEVRLYPYALSAEQIKAHYNLEYNKIVSDETTPGETYSCEITPNDGFDDGLTRSSNNVTIVWNITFNITSGEDGSQLTNVNIYCNNSWGVTGVSSPYSAGFLPGDYSCTFERTIPLLYYNKTISFVADNDKLINIVMSSRLYLSVEEHNWIEAIYKCLYSGDCLALNLLLNINQTTSKIWNQFKRTDQSVVTFENITNSIISNTSNLTIEYIVNVPIKEGYGLIQGIQGYDDFLPIRISYWFLDTTNTTCYNQGSKPVGVESPYCQALTVTTVGQINTIINFTVDLRPDLPVGNYTIVRSIEIDPDNRWIDYGQEIVGKVEILSSSKGLITLKHTGEIAKEILEAVGKIVPEIAPSETGIITGLASLLTATNISLIISLMTLGLVCYLIITMRRRH